ncbi:hypothetical protein FRB91_008992 [Serendipita sp. 411]|nr:hypothetical protein FRB91_008992 [Serendipita sp. 411]
MANLFPFHRCHLYIIIPIFQALVDDEEASLLDDPSLASSRPPVPRTLSLVCKGWSHVVSTTPSLWSTVVLDLNKRQDQITSHIATVRRHSLAWPLSVFIVNCHSPWYCGTAKPSPIHERSACPSRHSDIATYLNDIEHIGSLHFQGSDAYVIQRGLSNTFFNKTRKFSVDLSKGAGRSTYAIMKQVRAMPRVRTLNIKGLECSHITFNLRHPILSSLEVLHVESHQSYTPTSATLPNLLSNCPNLEKLYCRLKVHYGTSSFRPFKLDRLHTIDTTTLSNLRDSFLSGAISTPNIAILVHDQPAGALAPMLNDFVLRHPGLRVVSPPVEPSVPSPPPPLRQIPNPVIIAPSVIAPSVIAPSEAVGAIGEMTLATGEATAEGNEVPLMQVSDPTSTDTSSPSRTKQRGLWRKPLDSIVDLFVTIWRGLGRVSRR